LRGPFLRGVSGRLCYRTYMEQALQECRICARVLPLNAETFPRHAGRKSGFDSRCRPCDRIRGQARRDSGKKGKADPGYGRKWRAENPSYFSEWAAKNRDKIKGYSKARKPNPDRIRNYEPDKGAVYYAKNITKYKERDVRRRLRIKDAGEVISASEIGKMFAAQRQRCWWCNKGLTKFHLDHRIPLIEGGTNDVSNMVISCAPCNLKKGRKLPWQMKNPRLL
jgi:5-methylcytosine-specific restriction endonuclease McrA